jgi:hypothetical protein
MAPLVYLLFKNFKLLPIAILIILYTSLLFHDPDHKKPPLYWPFSEDEKYISLFRRMSTEKRKYGKKDRAPLHFSFLFMISK